MSPSMTSSLCNSLNNSEHWPFTTSDVIFRSDNEGSVWEFAIRYVPVRHYYNSIRKNFYITQGSPVSSFLDLPSWCHFPTRSSYLHESHLLFCLNDSPNPELSRGFLPSRLFIPPPNTRNSKSHLGTSLPRSQRWGRVRERRTFG